MKQTTYNLFTSAVLIAALWLGFVEQVEGAQYVVVFFVWCVWLPAVLFLGFSETAQKAIAAKPRPSWFKVFLGWLELFVTLGLLVWNGKLWTAGAVVLIILALAACKNEVNELRKKAAAQ